MTVAGINSALGCLTAAATRFIHSGESLSDFSSSVALKVPRALGVEDVKSSIAALINCHEMLRTRYEFECSPKFLIDEKIGDALNDSRSDIRTFDVTGMPRILVDEILREEVGVNREQLNPERGRMLAGVLVTGSPDGAVLLLTIHHLVLDGVSWRIIVEDLHTSFRQLAAGQSISLLPEVTTCVEWVQSMRGIANERKEQLDYWLDMLKLDRANHDTPSGCPAQATGLIVGPIAEQIIRRLPFVFGAPPSDIILAAYGIAISRATNCPSTILVQGHGRYSHLLPQVDLTRTVGWIADDYPVRIDGRLKSEAGAIRSAIETMPSAPEDYTLLRSYSESSSNAFKELGYPNYYFNFHGDIGQASESGLSDVGRLREWQIGNLDIFSLSLQCWILPVGEELAIEYAFYAPAGGFSQNEVENLATQWKEQLLGL